MLSGPNISAPAASRDATDAWKAAAILLAVLAPFFVYFGTARSIVDIWNSSETFAHGYVILPISLWLIWRRRRFLSLNDASPWWPGLLLLGGCGFGWLLAEIAAVQVVKQYAFVATIPLICLTVLGVRLTRAIGFPLLFLLFAVPFGEVFVDPLIGLTADFTVAALQLSGIPILRNGNHFDIPTGSWSVVEACSGVRYLISSVTLGCLYAYLNYRSRLRQVAFVILSIAAPIVANGVRAYLIVMIGHLSGMTLAVGVDHLIYGWIFFGFVMFIMFWIGSFWREDDTDPISAVNEELLKTTQASVPLSKIVAAAGLSILSISVWPLYADHVKDVHLRAEPVQVNRMIAAWKDGEAFTDWRPRFMRPSVESRQFFQLDTKKVGLSLMYYRDSEPDSKLISSINRMIAEGDKTFRQVASAARVETIFGQELKVRETTIDSAKVSFVVWHWYRIGNNYTSSDYVGKLLLAKEKLLMHSPDGVSIIVFAPFVHEPEEARTVLREFFAANADSVENTLSSARPRKTGEGK